MGDSYDEAFDFIVLQVTLLFFGAGGNTCCNCRLVEAALINLKVKDIIDGLREDK